MKKITKQEFDALPVVDGCKQCPGETDYSAIKRFPEGCSFGAWSRFGELCRFGDGCIFGELSSFGALSRFGAWCSFGEGCSFGAGCCFEGHKARTSNPYIAIDRAGSARRKTYFFDFEDGIYVRSGCFFGSLSEFRAKVLADECGNTATVKSMQYLGMANIAAVTFGRRELIDWGTCK